MCEGKAGKRETLTAQVRAERTPRELRLIREKAALPEEKLPEYEVLIPGEVIAEAFGLRLIASVTRQVDPSPQPAKLRIHKPGDRAQLRYSLGPKRMKEILERLKVPSDERKTWPVLEWQGEIVWMRGAELESAVSAASGLTIRAENLP